MQVTAPEVPAGERRARWIALAITLPYLSLGIFDALYSGWLSDPVWLYWAADVLENAVLGLVLLWVILRLTGWRPQEVGFALPPGNRAGIRLLAFSLFSVVLLGSSLTDLATGAIGISAPVGESEYDYSVIMPSDRTVRIIAVLYLCAASSFMEEIFYRGMLWRAISPPGSGLARQVAFVLLSAVIFGVSHTEQGLFGVVSTGLWGGLCAILLLAMRSLWPLIIAHAVTNLYQFRHELLG